MDSIAIRALPNEPAVATRLAEILVSTVAAGGSVHFMDPVPFDAAQAFWGALLADAEAGRCIVLGGFAGDQLAGTVTLFLDTPPNQPFRAELWKLMVAPAERGRGIARALVREAERLAVARERTLLTLDTALDGGGAAALYERLGWVLAGTIPDYAYKPQGGLVGTAIYYKRIAP
ncbi:MAG: hypothetical protein QOI11_2814 [Candidatus Eremiobacteraeota bacterium]|jgi:ribosomal protein S18 acetylase RimI-like enzyme|nr:hypothetical protein [Candidatus Eremiobacteraeota bacterium]